MKWAVDNSFDSEYLKRFRTRTRMNKLDAHALTYTH
jgi:hypothetical protein